MLSLDSPEYNFSYSMNALSSAKGKKEKVKEIIHKQKLK